MKAALRAGWMAGMWAALWAAISVDMWVVHSAGAKVASSVAVMAGMLVG